MTTYENAHMNRSPLKYPEADATAVAEMLKSSGYEVKVLTGKQATQAAIEVELTKFEQQGTQDGVVFIGLFGHGVQYGSEAYFGPYNTKLRKVTDFKGNTQTENGKPKLEPDPVSMISMQRLLEALNTAGAGNRVLMADCCREDPSAARGRAFGSSVKITDLEQGTAAIFSCSNSEQAFEHDDWGHGAFTKAFLDYCNGLGEGSDSTVSTMTTPLYRSVETLVKAKGETQRVNPITNGIVDLQIRLKQPALPDLITNSIGMKLKLIPAGQFKMGTSAQVLQQRMTDLEKEMRGRKFDSSVDAAKVIDSLFGDEYPQHSVEISRPFYAGQFEVTQFEYESVMGSNPSFFSLSGGGKSYLGPQDTAQFPVDSVSWYDAIDFCNRLSTKEGLDPAYVLIMVKRDGKRIVSAKVSMNPAIENRGYRLPTEAEWEYICRGGTETRFWFGDQAISRDANFRDDPPQSGTRNTSGNRPLPVAVGSFAPNPFGLYDTHGNVSEWCFDCYNHSAYSRRSGLTRDPVETTGDASFVRRGGDFTASLDDHESASRGAELPVLDHIIPYGFGFRVVR